MIVALLVVIILILLFSASVVKGWIANVAGFGCGTLAILVALLWLGSFFGESGFTYIVWGFMGILGLLAIAAVVVRADQPTQSSETSSPLLRSAIPSPLPTPPRELEQRDRVWGWFAEDIAIRFSHDARTRATEFYDANDVLGLENFCREESKRLRK